MADLVFNVAKGRIITYAGLPLAADSIIVVPILTAGIVDDNTMRTYANLSVLLAASNDEQAAMGRKTVANVTVTPSGPQQNVFCDDVVWAAATGAPISALVFCYKPDTASADTDIIPLAKYDFTITPNGNDITAKIPAGGFLRAT